MSVSRTWQDWSCEVRVSLATGDGTDLLAATRIVEELMGEVSGAASRFRADSDLSRINAAAGAPVSVSPLAVSLIDVALDAARRTGGAVDPTVGGSLLDAGYVDDIEVVRGGSARPHARAPQVAADWSAVMIDRELGQVGVPAGVRLDLGATAKAWAADEASRRVYARLGHAVLVGIGGDLAVAGVRAKPWHVDVSEVVGGSVHQVDVTYGGLATSSVLSRAWTSDRGAEHHLIDPVTARPAAGSVRTATVWAPTAVAANTWSTAAIVWGASAALRLCAAGVDARLVRTDGHVTVLGSWPAEMEVSA